MQFHIQTFIAQAEARIYRDLRVIDMEKALSGTLTNNTLAIPADYLELKEAYISTSSGFQPLERVDLWWMRQRYPTQTSQQAPFYIAREAQNFVVAPYPDQNYTVAGLYYARLPALSPTNTTNWLITKNPDLILAAALIEAATYLMDETGVPYWEQRYTQIAQAVMTREVRERYSGSPIQVRVS